MDPVEFARTLRSEAAVWDTHEELPRSVVTAVGEQGFLASDLPREYGGSASDPVELGRLCEAFGGVCSALRGLVTVQGMVAAAVRRWGTADQRANWLPALSTAGRVAAFAATEADAGSDLSAVGTRLERTGDTIAVHGRKIWVTFGAVADVLLVLGRTDGGPACVWIETDRPGITVEPVRGQLGMRAAQVAHIGLDGVRVPAGHLVGPPGFGLSHVAATALDHGRFTVAWGSAGMADACLGEAVRHTTRRRQGGVALAEHQLVRSKITQSLARVDAARAQCLRAAGLRGGREPEAIAETVLAKYVAARAAAAVSRDAVQLQGAAGCDPLSLTGRFFRDAKVMQIIEGADEIAEQHVAELAFRRYRSGELS